MGDRAARSLSARLDRLAAAAERSGAAAHAVARLLEAASVATMSAVALDLLADDAPRASRSASVEQLPVAAELREAA